MWIWTLLISRVHSETEKLSTFLRLYKKKYVFAKGIVEGILQWSFNLCNLTELRKTVSGLYLLNRQLKVGKQIPYLGLWIFFESFLFLLTITENKEMKVIKISIINMDCLMRYLYNAAAGMNSSHVKKYQMRLIFQ